MRDCRCETVTVFPSAAPPERLALLAHSTSVREPRTRETYWVHSLNLPAMPAGMYAALPYAFAQACIELPYIIVQSVVFSVLVYAMVRGFCFFLPMTLAHNHSRIEHAFATSQRGVSSAGAPSCGSGSLYLHRWWHLTQQTGFRTPSLSLRVTTFCVAPADSLRMDGSEGAKMIRLHHVYAYPQSAMLPEGLCFQAVNSSRAASAS